MAKGVSLTWDDRQKIRMIRNSCKDKKPKEMLPLVEKALKRHIAVSTLMNELVKMRQYERLNQQEEINERLSSWSLGTLTKYPMPAEVIPILLKISKEEETINIWQAQWVAKLFKIISNSGKLWLAAFWFAVYEESWEMSGNTKPCDTSMFDSMNPDEMLHKLFAYIDFEDSIYTNEAFEHQMAKRLQRGFNLHDFSSDYEVIKDSFDITDKK
jgi:hypothetical protein